VQTGLRISELTGLTRADLHLGAGANVACHGKGRKDRITPLTATTVAVLRDWLNEQRGDPTGPLFSTRRGRPLSRDAIEHRIALYAAKASAVCPSLRVELHLSSSIRCSPRRRSSVTAAGISGRWVSAAASTPISLASAVTASRVSRRRPARPPLDGRWRLGRGADRRR
jgi:Phage integrase family